MVRSPSAGDIIVDDSAWRNVALAQARKQDDEKFFIIIVLKKE